MVRDCQNKNKENFDYKMSFHVVAVDRYLGYVIKTKKAL